MPSIINATTTNGVAVSGDNSGALALQTNNGTTAVTIDTAQNATFAQTINAPNTFGFKNRIINGQMAIDQRQSGNALTVSPSNNQYYGIDRYQVWSFPVGAAGTWTWQQQTATPPAGFTYYGRATVTTPDSSVAGNDFYTIQQAVEGFSTADLNFGTANAKPFAVSFWVRSSVTGTFSCSPYFANANQGYPLTYTINAANTWEYKTLSFPALTSSSLSNTDKTNGAALYLVFSLGMGSSFTGTAGVLATNAYGATGATNLISTNGATFDITGIQFEVGTAATSFDYRPYGTELALCQRYFFSVGGQIYSTASIGGTAYSTNWCFGLVKSPVTMRAMPTFTKTGNWQWNDYNAVSTNTGDLTFTAQNSTLDAFWVASHGTSSGLTALQAYLLSANNSATARLSFSAEL